MKVKRFRIISFIVLLSWMLLIFLLSNETAAESSFTSGGFSRLLFRILYPHFKDMTSIEQSELLEAASFIIRKLAHFTIYLVLGIFASLTVISYRKFDILNRAAAAWLICVFYSISDEIHQTFIDGRSGELRDVLIDSSGAFISVLIIFILATKIKRIYSLVRKIDLE